MLHSKEQILSYLLKESIKYPTSIGACATYADTYKIICTKFNKDLDDKITNYSEHAEILCMEYMNVTYPDTDYDLYITIAPCKWCTKRIKQFNHKENIKNIYTTNLICRRMPSHNFTLLDVDTDNYLQHCLTQPWANLLKLQKPI